jgi:hypothetical protein
MANVTTATINARKAAVRKSGGYVIKTDGTIMQAIGIDGYTGKLAARLGSITGSVGAFVWVPSVAPTTGYDAAVELIDETTDVFWMDTSLGVIETMIASWALLSNGQ